MKRSIYILTVLLLVSSGILAHVKPARTWATCTFNKSKVMVGEPMVLTVTVYTSTWFTQPPVFSEIQVKGALMVRLASRGGARSVTIGRQSYPSIQQQYVVYPSLIGTNTLPAVKVEVETPPEGGYKGVRRTIYSKERTFEVTAPPDGIDTANWMTAYDLRLTDSWDKPLEGLKAGDIIERRVRIEASGTLSAAIAPPQIQEVAFGTIYPQTAQLTNRQNNASFSGTRTDIMRYLLEKEGNFEIPDLEVSYFSLRDKKLITKTIEARSISVAPNPDLAFILSQQELLQQELAKEQEAITEVTEAWSYLGLNAWQWSLIVAALTALLYLMLLWIRKLRIRIENKKKIYLDSEDHHFKLLEKTAKSAETRTFIRQLGFWFDRYRIPAKLENLRTLAQADPQGHLGQQIEQLAVSAYKEDRMSEKIQNGPEMVDGIRRSKKNKKQQKQKTEERFWNKLNP